jgi:hypothetical protein
MNAWTYPILPSDIFDATDRYICHLKGLQVCLGFIVPYLDLTITILVSQATDKEARGHSLETADDMWFCGMKVNRFDSI